MWWSSTTSKSVDLGAGAGSTVDIADDGKVLGTIQGKAYQSWAVKGTAVKRAPSGTQFRAVSASGTAVGSRAVYSSSGGLQSVIPVTFDGANGSRDLPGNGGYVNLDAVSPDGSWIFDGTRAWHNRAGTTSPGGLSVQVMNAKGTILSEYINGSQVTRTTGTTTTVGKGSYANVAARVINSSGQLAGQQWPPGDESEIWTSYVLATKKADGTYSYSTAQKFVFNNMVLFKV